MAIAFRSGATNSAASVSSLVLTFGSQVGDWLFVSISTYVTSGAVPTASSVVDNASPSNSFTLVGRSGTYGTTSQTELWVFKKVANTCTSITITLSATAGFASATVGAWTGAGATGNSQTTTGTLDANGNGTVTVTTQVVNAWVIMAAGDASFNTASWGASSPNVLRESVNLANGSVATGDAPFTSAGSSTVTLGDPNNKTLAYGAVGIELQPQISESFTASMASFGAALPVEVKATLAALTQSFSAALQAKVQSTIAAAMSSFAGVVSRLPVTPQAISAGLHSFSAGLSQLVGVSFSARASSFSAALPGVVKMSISAVAASFAATTQGVGVLLHALTASMASFSGNLSRAIGAFMNFSASIKFSATTQKFVQTLKHRVFGGR